MDEPLRGSDAKRLVRRILKNGEVTFTKHAEQEMRNDRLDDRDVTNVLRGGQMLDADVEWENGAWRYKCRTRKIVVVIEFEIEEDFEPDELVVITAWKLR